MIITEILIFTETRMIDIFNTDYKDYKDGCAALHKIHIIRVEKRICANLLICENLCNLWLKEET